MKKGKTPGKKDWSIQLWQRPLSLTQKKGVAKKKGRNKTSTKASGHKNVGGNGHWNFSPQGWGEKV